MNAAVVTVPAAVAAADHEVSEWEERYDAIAANLASLRRQLDSLREFVRLAEEQEHSAGLHMDTARRNAGLARKAAGLVRTAGGYVNGSTS